MPRTGEDRIVTVPNILTLVRLAGTPVFVWLLLARDARYSAALLLAFLGATDCADGYVARHFDQESQLGKVLDPTADRLLLGAAVVTILIDGSVPTWVAVLALAREVFMAGVVLVLAAMGARRIIEVKLIGKAGTFALMVAFPLFLAANPVGGAPWHDVAEPLAWVAAIVGLVLAWASVVAYIPDGRAALAQARARPAAR